MANNLVIVESPAKAKTIKQYLGKSYNVVASMGHVRDLPKSQLGIDVEGDFEPKYITIRGKGDLLSKLKKDAKAANKVYLATDPDREGEAISWHLAQLLDIDEKSKCRITFNEITKNAVTQAIKEPRTIDMDLVNSQQARRVLDRIVGYKISPILWRKVKKGLSAGRVQSVATRIIVDREREIEGFIPEEFWTVGALLKNNDGAQFEATLISKNGKKIKPSQETEVTKISQELKKETFIVKDIKTGEKKRYPSPPFTTSTLQQEASRKLNYTVKKTMVAAQKLYEGVQLQGHGTIGLITYMSTDSLRISADALSDVRNFIGEKYGATLLPDKANVYKTKNSAQDAHEAIRPTYVSITPAEVKDQLPSDMYKTYKLIWERFVASQMKPAIYETATVDIQAGEYGFRESGSKLVFKGYMSVYVEGKDEESTEKDNILPPLAQGEKLTLIDLKNEQHFTQPPLRYTEATLIKALEEKGIGRPSTYAPTITTITARGYVSRDKKQLYPTELGTVVTDIMIEHFPDVAGTEFTAEMEERLDKIESGDIDWVKILSDFYGPFAESIKKADGVIGKVKIADEESDVLCDKCGRKMVYKMGRFGKFLACPGFPECRNAKPIVKETGVNCPKCGKKILEKKSKTGKVYYGCEDNPVCDFMSWDAPVKGEKCPQCNGILVRKKGRNTGKVCINPECGYKK